LEKLTEVEKMTEFIHKICFQSQMEYECVVASIVYIQRLVKMSIGTLYLTPDNWKAITLACMVLGSKVFDDFAMLNGDYCVIFPGLKIQRVNDLELSLLDGLSYELWITRREYAEMHFAIQDMITAGIINQVKLTASLIQHSIAPVHSTPKEARSSTLMSGRNSRIASLAEKHRAQVQQQRQEENAESEEGEAGRSRGSSIATNAEASVAAARSRAASEDVSVGSGADSWGEGDEGKKGMAFPAAANRARTVSGEPLVETIQEDTGDHCSDHSGSQFSPIPAHSQAVSMGEWEGGAVSSRVSVVSDRDNDKAGPETGGGGGRARASGGDKGAKAENTRDIVAASSCCLPWWGRRGTAKVTPGPVVNFGHI
jgi:hypothetical protein